jgi:hypothetical protein
VECLLNALNDMVVVPERKTDAPMRVPISGAYKIKGVGDVLAGRVEQGIVKPGDEVGGRAAAGGKNNWGQEEGWAQPSRGELVLSPAGQLSATRPWDCTQCCTLL